MSCYTDDGVFARRTASCVSAPCSAPSSPRSRVKFLCSHGGKILPRPSDGQLKYVGGETRVISVPRDISFQEVMKRLTYMIEGGMVLKYQLATEDLDALVTVKSDEDLGHMFDEMEHYQMMGFPRMRTFLFPIHNIVMDEQLPLDQRYIFSINGIITPSSRHLPNPNPTPTKHLASSGCTSPRSPDSYAAEANFNNTFGNMHRIRSSPSICNLLNIPQQNNHHSPHHQLPPQYYHSSNTTPQHTHSGYRSPNPPVSMRSGARFHQENSTPPSYYYASRGGNEYCTKCMHNDNCGHVSDRTVLTGRGPYHDTC